MSQSSPVVPVGPLDFEPPSFKLDWPSFCLGLLSGLLLLTVLDLVFLARLSLTVFLRERGVRTCRPLGWFKALDE